MNLAFAKLVRMGAGAGLCVCAGLVLTLSVPVPHWAAAYNAEALPYYAAAGALLAHLTDRGKSEAFVNRSQRRKMEHSRRIDELLSSFDRLQHCANCGATMVHSRQKGYYCIMGCDFAESRTPTRESPPNVTGKPPVA